MKKVAIESEVQFSALIDAAERCETIIMTRDGRAVGQIGPVASTKVNLTADEAVKRILARNVRVGATARELIDEGRKY